VSLAFQLVGSLLVLAGFAASQFGWLDTKSMQYLIVNAVGSGVLAADAVYEAQWGFLLLEGAWAIVSVAGLLRPGGRRRVRRTPRSDPGRGGIRD
jgi:hypothetical protein